MHWPRGPYAASRRATMFSAGSLRSRPRRISKTLFPANALPAMTTAPPASRTTMLRLSDARHRLLCRYELAYAAGLQRGDPESPNVLRRRRAARWKSRADASRASQTDLRGLRQRVPDEMRRPAVGGPLLFAGGLRPPGPVSGDQPAFALGKSSVHRGIRVPQPGNPHPRRLVSD